MRKLCGSIKRIAIFFMAVMLTVQTAAVTPVFAEGQDNKLQVEIFVTKRDNLGTSREDYYYIGKANITYPENVSLDAIYDDILKQGKKELSWSDAQSYGVKVDFDIQNDEFATVRNCQGSKQYNKLDNIKSDAQKEMKESFSWLRLRRRAIGHWHIDGAITFTEKQTYKVTFRDADGTILDEQDVKEGESAKAPSNPSKEGYTFTGWDKPLDNISGDTDITAEYEVIKNKVTFEDEDGNKLKDVDVEYNGSVSEGDIPQAPSKEGYTFVGWDAELDNITEDITVRPKYKKNEEPEQPAQPEQPTEPEQPAQPEVPGSDNEPSNNVPANNAPADSTPAAPSNNVPADSTPAAPSNNVPTNNTPADNSSNDANNAGNVADTVNDNQNVADESDTDDSDADDSENGNSSNNRNNGNNTANTANNTNNGTNVPAPNNTVAVTNLIPQNDDTQDAIANIIDEQTPLAAGDENTDSDNNDDKAVTTIADDDTPLAAAEDNCIIHWIILLLTLLGAGYTIIRVVLANKQEQEEENKQEA